MPDNAAPFAGTVISKQDTDKIRLLLKNQTRSRSTEDIPRETNSRGNPVYPEIKTGVLWASTRQQKFRNGDRQAGNRRTAEPQA